MSKIKEYGQFCVWSYPCPAGTRWAFALLSECGTFYETSKCQADFNSEAGAIAVARQAIASSQS